METIGVVLGGVRICKGTTYEHLTVFPMILGGNGNGNGNGSGERRYLTLGEAIGNGLAAVREVSAGGSVPELLFENRAELPVLIVDGEELVGAKQNRTANLTVLAPPRKTIVIPVSCVEAGRWSSTSKEFAVSERAHFAGGRAAKMATVSDSMRRTGSRRSDQGRVWGDIACACDRLQAPSPTRAMAAIFEHHRTTMDDYVRAFRATSDQAGAMFAIGGRVGGFDLFDSPATLNAMLAKLVRSWAVEALGRGPGDDKPPGRKRATSFLHAAREARIESYPAVGMGIDIRLTGADVIGGGLVHEECLTHLAVFGAEQEAGDGARRGSRGMASARARRNSRRRG